MIWSSAQQQAPKPNGYCCDPLGSTVRMYLFSAFARTFLFLFARFVHSFSLSVGDDNIGAELPPLKVLNLLELDSKKKISHFFSSLVFFWVGERGK